MTTADPSAPVAVPVADSQTVAASLHKSPSLRGSLRLLFSLQSHPSPPLPSASFTDLPGPLHLPQWCLPSSLDGSHPVLPGSALSRFGIYAILSRFSLYAIVLTDFAGLAAATGHVGLGFFAAA